MGGAPHREIKSYPCSRPWIIAISPSVRAVCITGVISDVAAFQYRIASCGVGKMNGLFVLHTMTSNGLNVRHVPARQRINVSGRISGYQKKSRCENGRPEKFPGSVNIFFPPPDPPRPVRLPGGNYESGNEPARPKRLRLQFGGRDVQRGQESAFVWRVSPIRSGTGPNRPSRGGDLPARECGPVSAESVHPYGSSGYLCCED